jgi:hypothetical protein
MRKLMKALKTEISGDLQDLAKMLQSKGRGKDTILAHITPKEAARLKSAGGRGSRNPKTGLLEFDTVDLPPPTYETPSVSGSMPDVTVTAPAEPSSNYTPVTDYSYLSGGGGNQITAPQAYSTSESSFSSDPFNTPAPTSTPIGGVSSFPSYGLQPLSSDIPRDPYGPSEDTSTDTSNNKTLSQRLGLNKLSGQDLARLGLAGAGGIAGALQSRKAGKQIESAQREQQAMAQPYQKMGNELVGQASKGILSPASQQAYQAAQAQLTQNAQNRGGVGVEQAQNQLAMIRTNLLNNQMQYGLQIAQVGDKMALGALQTGLQLDQQLNQTSQAFYTQLASIAAGLPMYRA